RLAWVGFDCLLLVAMARTAWLAARASPFVVNVASATAALLIVDAWFDLTTSPPGRERLYAVLAAALLELPAAALSLWIAVRAQRVIAPPGALPPHRLALAPGWLRGRPSRPADRDAP